MKRNIITIVLCLYNICFSQQLIFDSITPKQEFQELKQNIASSQGKSCVNYLIQRKYYSSNQGTPIMSLGISGNYYYTADNGKVIGLSGKISYYFNQISGVCGIIRKGIGAPVLGASEPRQEWNNDISSFTDITFLYRHNLPEILDGLFIGSGLSHLYFKLEDDTKYSYFSLPIVLWIEFQLTKSLYFNVGINSNINKKITLWGFDLGISYKLIR